METSAADHYATLGLDRRCTLAQIRAAYRALAKRSHPDVNDGSSEAAVRTQELNAAHEVLSDAGRRRAYDQTLRNEDEAAANRPRGRIERNVSQDVHLRIEELFRGAALEVIVRDPANPEESETYPLQLPAMTAPGTRFRLPRIAPFAGGHVVVRVRALSSARFKVRGSDLRTDLRINSRRATAGGTEMIASPTGSQLRVEIPPRIRRGEILKINGEGLPRPRGGRGDLLVRVTYRPEVQITRR